MTLSCHLESTSLKSLDSKSAALPLCLSIWKHSCSHAVTSNCKTLTVQKIHEPNGRLSHKKLLFMWFHSRYERPHWQRVEAVTFSQCNEKTAAWYFSYRHKNPTNTKTNNELIQQELSDVSYSFVAQSHYSTKCVLICHWNGAQQIQILNQIPSRN